MRDATGDRRSCSSYFLGACFTLRDTCGPRPGHCLVAAPCTRLSCPCPLFSRPPIYYRSILPCKTPLRTCAHFTKAFTFSSSSTQDSLKRGPEMTRRAMCSLFSLARGIAAKRIRRKGGHPFWLKIELYCNLTSYLLRNNMKNDPSFPKYPTFLVSRLPPP